MFFKYVSLTAAFIAALSVIITAIDYLPIARNTGIYAGVFSENLRNTMAICMNLSIAIVILEIVILLWRFVIMSLLPKHGYRHLVISLVVLPLVSVINVISQVIMEAEIVSELFGRDYDVYLPVFSSVILLAVSFVLNFIYFRKRKAIFDENTVYPNVEAEEKPAATRLGKWKQRIKEKRAIASRKEILCPRPLRWFKFFKYSSIVVFAVELFTILYVLIVTLPIFTMPEYVAILPERYRNAVLVYVIISIVPCVLSMALSLWRFIIMSLLQANGYKRFIIIVAISYALSFIARMSDELFKAVQMSELYGRTYDGAIGGIIIAAISVGLFFTLNYIYFKKRKILFSDDILDADKMRGNMELVSECPDCGETIPDGQMFCEKCGANISYQPKK